MLKSGEPQSEPQLVGEIQSSPFFEGCVPDLLEAVDYLAVSDHSSDKMAKIGDVHLVPCYLHGLQSL